MDSVEFGHHTPVTLEASMPGINGNGNWTILGYS
jgi:hypothetical protein